MAARPQKSKLQSGREARAKERGRSDANKTRATTVTNNKTATVRKTMVVMVANLVKGNRDNRRFDDQGKNHKVKEIVAMIADQQQDFQAQTSWTTC